MNNTHLSYILSGECLQVIIRKIGIDTIMDKLIERTFDAYLNFDENNSIMQVRSGYNYMEPREGLIEWMPIRDIAKEEVVLKVVAYHPHNPATYQLPTVLSTISKYSTTTGHLESIVDGVLTTSLRTGASSAIASKLLGHPNSKVLGLIGCGAQAITQLHALSRVFHFDSVLYFDIDNKVQNTFEERADVLGLDLIYESTTIEQIVKSSDILSTATSIGVGKGPLFEYVNTKQWLHINAVGSDFPGKIELPKALLENSYVCPDFIDQAMIEGECQQLTKEQMGEDLITCLKKANHIQDLKNELTVFDSTGMALQDQIVADLFLSYAKEMNLGEYVQLENANIEAQNPYSFLLSKRKH